MVADILKVMGIVGGVALILGVGGFITEYILPCIPAFSKMIREMSRRSAPVRTGKKTHREPERIPSYDKTA